ncbi:FtsX-like permease family protein [Kitasatospora sp. NBC_01560]|uniref:ABC transporter permease n=1 Tax=Kitasatospora sp. NBC_01560 TaxID=2975965 RepID=UPI00387046A0
MLRTALRNVLAHRARLVMTALAITLGVAFVSGTLVFGDSVAEALRGASARSLKDVAVAVQAETRRNSTEAADDTVSTALTGQLADQVRAVPGVTSVRPTVSGTATLAAKDGRPLNADTTWQNLATNYAPDAPRTDRDARYPVSAGRGPVADGEIALDRRTAEKAGYRLGDSVRFATTGPTLTKTLVGTVDTDDPRVRAGGSLALFDTGTAQRLFLQEDRFDELAVGSAPGTDNQELTSRIRALLPAEGITVTSGARLAQQQAEQIAENTKELTRTLLAFAGIALFVGAFLIANTFTMLIAQRRRETALLRAIGALRHQVVRAVLVEATLLGLAASAAGFALGLGIATAVGPLLGASGLSLPAGPLVVSADTLLRSLAVGVGITVLAAWLPARRAARVAPVEALNTVDQAPPKRSTVLRHSLGGLLTGLGVLCMLYVAAQRDGGDTNLQAAALGSVLTLTGMIVIAPLLSRPLIRLAGTVTTRFFGVSGRLAEENALRNPRRTAATASALMIGLTLITGLSVTGSSTGAALRDAAVRGLTADYKVSNAGFGGIDPALAADVARVPGVAEAVPVASAGLAVPGAYDSITGADPRRLGTVTGLTFSSGSLADVGPGRIALSDKLAARAGLTKGDTFRGTVGFGREQRELTVAGIYRQTRIVGDALGTLDDVLPHAIGGRFESILVKAAADRSPAGLDRGIREALGNSPLLRVQDQQQLTKAQSGPIDAVLTMMYGLLGMTVAIGVLGVVNTLAMSVFERTREVGLLRAIGLDRKGVGRMVRLESVVISLFGAALGIGTGLFLAWACGSLTAASLPQYTLVLPWARLGLFLLLGPAIGVLAALWPARRAARLDVLHAINADQ